MQTTLRSMSEPDLNEQLIRAFIEYSKWSTRFDLFGYKQSAVNARTALRDIRRIAQARYQEIHRQKVALHGNQNQDEEATDNDN